MGQSSTSRLLQAPGLPREGLFTLGLPATFIFPHVSAPVMWRTQAPAQMCEQVMRLTNRLNLKGVENPNLDCPISVLTHLSSPLQTSKIVFIPVGVGSSVW